MQDIIMFFSNHVTLSAAAIGVLILILLVEGIRARGKKSDLTAAEAIHMINHKNAIVVDTRTESAFKQGHIIDAHSISFREIQENPKRLEKFKNKPIIVVCAQGKESQKTAAFLSKQGYNAFSIMDGIRGWTEAQLPLIKG